MTATAPRLQAEEPLVGSGAAAEEITASDTWEADWRFLLGSSGLGRVAVMGNSDGALVSALRTVATSVHTDGDRDPGEGAAPSAPFDTVVLDRPRQEGIAQAVSLVAPGGALFIRRTRRAGRTRLVRRLVAAGFEEVSLHWHRPTIGRTTLLVSLEDSASAATVLRSVRAGRKGAIEAALVSSGLVSRGGRNVSLLACRAGSGGCAVAAPRPGLGLAGLITPRFAASQAVIGLSVDSAQGALDQVVKVPRLPEGSAQVVHEAVALQAFAELGGSSGIPAHRVVQRGNRHVLVESVAEGRPLDRRMVRSDPDRALRAGLSWLTDVPRGPASVPVDDGRHDTLLGAAATTLIGTGTAAGDGASWRVAAAHRTLDLLEPLSTAPVPVVFEHGDLSHPNLFLGADGRLAVIDWERANPCGMPLHDAFFFCGYLAAASARSGAPEAVVDAYLDTTGSHGWARAQVELHAERMEVDRPLLHLLELAAWFRASAVLAEGGAPDPSSGPQRHEVIWMALLDSFGGWNR